MLKISQGVTKLATDVYKKVTFYVDTLYNAE